MLCSVAGTTTLDRECLYPSSLQDLVGSSLINEKFYRGGGDGGDENVDNHDRHQMAKSHMDLGRMS